MNLLDHGSLQLVNHMGNDVTVVNAARVSFANEDWFKEIADLRDGKLITYLANHKHVSPFYHPQLMFRVKAPISIQRQWFKHKIGTAENSESTRYIEVHKEFYLPANFRVQSKSNKQGSAEDFNAEVNSELRASRSAFYDIVWTQYQSELTRGAAKELARGVLPLETYTSWVWTASLYAVIHFIHLRDEAHAQWEIRQYAQALSTLTKQHFPLSLAAYGIE